MIFITQGITGNGSGGGNFSTRAEDYTNDVSLRGGDTRLKWGPEWSTDVNYMYIK